MNKAGPTFGGATTWIPVAGQVSAPGGSVGLQHRVSERVSADAGVGCDDFRRARTVGRALALATVVVDAGASRASLSLLGVAPDRAAWIVMFALIAAWLLLLDRCGAYRRGVGYSKAVEARTIVVGVLAGALALLGLGSSLVTNHWMPAWAALIGAVGLFGAGRLSLRGVARLLRRRGQLIRRALVVGDGPDAREFLANLAAWPGLGVRVVAVCADAEDRSIEGVPVRGPARRCAWVARELGVATVFFAPGAMSTENCTRVYDEVLGSGLELVMVAHAPLVADGRLSMRQFGGQPVLRFDATEGWLRPVTKRVLDVLVAGALLVLLAVPLFAVAAIIRLDSPGPALFRQRRVGRGGMNFTMWKFRTMQVGSEQPRAAIEAIGTPEAPVGLGARPGMLFKLKRDPRVTRVGRWLRRFSVDELPQLWNVLRGEMSLVGPRPALPEEAEAFDELTLSGLRVRPGMTGLWQVSGRADAPFAAYRRMGAFYAGNWSLLGDLRILARTVSVVWSGRGAY